MPVTEFVTFKLKEPYTIENQELRQRLLILSDRQSNWSLYPLMFYVDIEDQAVIYLISSWESVAVHTKWIESEQNQDLLKMFETILSITNFTHIDFDSTEIDPDVLAFKKYALESGGLPSEDTTRSLVEPVGTELWLKEGPSIEKPEEIYTLSAWIGLEDVKKAPTSWRCMRRLLIRG